MESIVERLIKVEEEAKKLVEAAREEEEGLIEQLKREREDIEASILHDIQKEIAITKEFEAKRLAVARVQIQEQEQIKLADMDKQYNQHSADWCGEIFGAILGK